MMAAQLSPVRTEELIHDAGDVDAYPREGLCLAVLSDGRARPAWLCQEAATVGRGDDEKRKKVLLYGDPSGRARALLAGERVDPLPDDSGLAARLQNDWADATPAERDAGAPRGDLGAECGQTLGRFV